MTRTTRVTDTRDERRLPALDPDASSVRAAIRAVRAGDRDAFGHVVDVYQRRLFGLALMMTRDPAGAEEIAQDAIFRAFQHLDVYEDSRPFYPWISTIAVRLAQNWLVRRTGRTRREGAVLTGEEAVASHEADALATLIADESDRRLWHLVAGLPSGERTAVILYYRHDMRVGDVAKALGVTDGTIKTLLFRARRRLRRALGDLHPGKDRP
jgi:RNA polymerase sigma-70 factor, ECF subfamily